MSEIMFLHNLEIKEISTNHNLLQFNKLFSVNLNRY